MKPTIDFHGIASLELTPIIVLSRSDGSTFATRYLTFKDEKGNTFRIGLFAENEATLRVQEPREFSPVYLEAQKPVLTTVSELKARMDACQHEWRYERASGISTNTYVKKCVRCDGSMFEDFPRGETPPPALNPKTGKLVPW